MKNFIFISVLFLFFTTSVLAIQTEASKFALDEYKKSYPECIKINVKNEYINEYQQKIGKLQIPIIVYGWGDMKIKKHKKCRISYIVLYNSKFKPFWSDIYPSK